MPTDHMPTDITPEDESPTQAMPGWKILLAITGAAVVFIAFAVFVSWPALSDTSESETDASVETSSVADDPTDMVEAHAEANGYSVSDVDVYPHGNGDAIAQIGSCQLEIDLIVDNGEIASTSFDQQLVGSQGNYGEREVLQVFFTNSMDFINRLPICGEPLAPMSTP